MSTPNRTLAERLAHLSDNERRKLYKRAALLKKSSQIHRPRRARHDDDEDQDGGRMKMKTGGSSLDDYVLKLLDLEELEQHALVQGDVERSGVVTWVGPKTCRVECGKTPYEVGLNGYRVAVGDEVTFGGDGDEARLSRLMPRRTKLSRPDPATPHRELVIVANVDVVAIVVSVKAPPLHPRLIDRYLIAIQAGGAQPMVVVNKLDLLAEGDNELSKLEPYEALGIPVAGCSTQTGAGIDALREMLAGKLAAFGGHSGVGKSSLLNALHPELGIDTGEVWQGYGRGTHTTTASTMHDIGGARVVDTPGVRSFGLWQMSAGDLKFYFQEFNGCVCRFSNCTHIHEPGCGVKAAVALGRISAERYDTYCRLATDT